VNFCFHNIMEFIEQLPPSSGRWVSRAREIGLRYGNRSDKVEPWPDQWRRGWGLGESKGANGRGADQGSMLSDRLPYLKQIPRARLTHRPDDGDSKHL
jgi:hypothetical protein